MNMTGDPNQRNKPLFGFECSYPSSTASLPRFVEGAPAMNPPVDAPTAVEEPTQCLFATTSSSPFPFNSFARVPSEHVPFSSGYVFPSTSSLNMLTATSPNRISFPFSQNAASTSSSNSFLENCGQSNAMQGQPSYPFANNQLRWSPSVQPGLPFIASSSNISTAGPNFASKRLAGVFSCKRKTESPPLTPFKQHITEERMAEHMSRLHISSQTPISSRESQPVRERRLYMCEEMQRLQTESIIPAQILEKVHRPCTALVPWRPPIVLPISKENNNNEEEPDNNITEVSNSSGMDMES